jgi:PIN domain nuclease of toxin-antitoxin system
MAGEANRIGKRAAMAIETNGDGVLVSTVTIWEVAIKRRLGKLEAPANLLQLLEDARVNLLSISPRHADRVNTLPLHHRDPFDRLLVAQASVEGLVLLSKDAEMRSYDIDVLW